MWPLWAGWQAAGLHPQDRATLPTHTVTHTLEHHASAGTLLLLQGETGEVYNIGTEKERTVKEVRQCSQQLYMRWRAGSAAAGMGCLSICCRWFGLLTALAVALLCFAGGAGHCCLLQAAVKQGCARQGEGWGVNSVDPACIANRMGQGHRPCTQRLLVSVVSVVVALPPLLLLQDRAFNDRRYYIGSSKLGSLGWRERTSWEDGLRKTIDW